MPQQVNRRFFLKSVASMGGVFFVGLWYKMIGDKRKNVPLDVVTVPLEDTSSVRFFDRFIIVNDHQEYSVLSSKCTHLGCRIQKLNKGNLQCPCHGSSFNLKGEVLSGPAFKSLPKLPFEVNKEQNTLTVFLS